MMNNITAFFKSERNYILSCYCMVFLLPSFPFLSSFSLIVFFVFSLSHLKQHNNNKHLKSMGVFLILFLMYVVSLFFSPYTERALELIFRIAPTFIFPLLIYYSKLHHKINYSLLKNYFLLGVIVSCLVSLLASLIISFLEKDYQYLFYYNLGKTLHIHPTYYSLFVLTAIHFNLTNQNKLMLKYKPYISSLLFLMVFLLQSKTALVVFIGYALFIVIANKFSFRNNKEMYIPLAFIILIIALSSSLNKNRFNEFFKSSGIAEIGTFQENGIAQRLWLWNEAIEQIKQSPLIGFGIGAQNKKFKWEVEKKTLNNNFSLAYTKAIKRISLLNLHNQYLQILYDLGIVGLSLFVFFVIQALFLGFKNKNISFVIVFLYFTTFLWTENLLDRQAGVYFYSVILSLLYFEDWALNCKK